MRFVYELTYVLRVGTKVSEDRCERVWQKSGSQKTNNPQERVLGMERGLRVLAHRQLLSLGRCFAKSIAQTTENDLVNSEGSISCIHIKEEEI